MSHVTTPYTMMAEPISCIYVFRYTGPPKTGKNVDA